MFRITPCRINHHSSRGIPPRWVPEEFAGTLAALCVPVPGVCRCCRRPRGAAAHGRNLWSRYISCRHDIRLPPPHAKRRAKCRASRRAAVSAAAMSSLQAVDHAGRRRSCPPDTRCSFHHRTVINRRLRRIEAALQHHGCGPRRRGNWSRLTQDGRNHRVIDRALQIDAQVDQAWPVR